ncbi:MAG: outer membrane lipoprotein chaperone LolA [Porticoccus sp.]|nr:outer membrane lipoprotein chaperone LolA [Porticoccus sp.]
MKKLLFGLLLGSYGLLVSVHLYAGGLPGGGSELRLLLTNLNTLNTSFQQTVYASDGTALQQTSGQLQAARPGKVRWQAEPPMEQLLVSDGETLWIYDPDLEQVTIKPFDQDLSKTPAILFIGNLDTLEQSYTIYIEKVYIEQGEVVNFSLIPIADNSLYEKVALIFSGETPTTMALWDSLGQKTEINFSHTALNEPLDPALFSFEPPDGVDILRDE